MPHSLLDFFRPTPTTKIKPELLKPTVEGVSYITIDEAADAVDGSNEDIHQMIAIQWIPAYTSPDRPGVLVAADDPWIPRLRDMIARNRAT